MGSMTKEAALTQPLAMAAAVPAFKCPPGTKMHILDLGTLRADEAWYANRIEDEN